MDTDSLSVDRELASSLLKSKTRITFCSKLKAKIKLKVLLLTKVYSSMFSFSLIFFQNAVYIAIFAPKEYLEITPINFTRLQQAGCFVLSL